MEPIDLPVDYGALPEKPPRHEILEKRIAENIGPLLGVPNPDGPFGEMSWLSTYEGLHLEDIRRGAPKPPSDMVGQMMTDGLLDNAGNILSPNRIPQGFIVHERYVYGKVPNPIVAASLNRFGPDTKAASLLAGTNMLLRGQTALLTEACQTDTFKELPPAIRVRTYGAMMLGVCRPQPLLITTGIGAQNVQKASLPTAFGISRKLNHSKNPRARCEIGGEKNEKAAPRQPLIFDVIDSSMTHLANSLRDHRSLRPGFDIEHALTYALHGVLRGLKLKESYDPETERRTARAVESPKTVGERFLRLTPHLI